jgi:hypothetical protein
MKALLKLSLWELMGHVYARYPEYASRTVHLDDELMPTMRRPTEQQPSAATE